MTDNAISVLKDSTEIVSFEINELNKISKMEHNTFIPAENYYFVQDIKKIEALPTPIVIKNKPNHITDRLIKHLKKGINDKYGGIINETKKEIKKLTFKKDIFFGKYLIESFQDEFKKLKKGLHKSDLNKILIENADQTLWKLTEKTLDELFQRYDVANFFYELHQNSESLYSKISQHSVNVAFLTIYFGLAFAMSQQELKSQPRCQPEILGEILGVGAFFHDYGVENIMLCYQYGTKDFLKAWGEKGEILFGLMKNAKIPIESKVMMKFQTTNIIDNRKNYGFYTKILQIANAMECLVSGHSIIKIGSYHELVEEGRNLKDAMSYLIIHSRKKRHEYDCTQIFEDKIVKFIVHLCDFSYIWDYQEIIKNRVRNGGCGKAIICPNEIDPVTALCPIPDKVISCGGTSHQANTSYKGSMFYRCKDIHQEITKINETLKNKNSNEKKKKNVQKNEEQIKNKEINKDQEKNVSKNEEQIKSEEINKDQEKNAPKNEEQIKNKEISKGQ